MKRDNYKFYPVTRTETIDGRRVTKLMAIHKVTGETAWFSAEEIDKPETKVKRVEGRRLVDIG